MGAGLAQGVDPRAVAGDSRATNEFRALNQKADAAVQAAESKKGLGGLFSSFASGTSKSDMFQDAINLYIQAANAARLCQSYMESGQAQEKAAAVYRDKMSREDASYDYGNEVATCFVDAAKAYTSANSLPDTVRCLEEAIQKYLQPKDGRQANYRRAATLKDQQADTYIKLGDVARAADCYKQAAMWNMEENSPAIGNGIKLKAANILASETLKQYSEARQLFEDVATYYARDKMMSSSAKTPFFMALLCSLAMGDLIDTERKIDEYRTTDPSFGQQRECLLVQNLMEAIKAGNVPQFEDHLFAWYKTSGLDELKKSLLLEAKSKIVGNVGGVTEDGDDEFS